MLKNVSLPLVIVILNNAGGGIFRFLPIANHEQIYSPYFDTPHEHDFALCCRGFGIEYTLADTQSAFVAAYRDARLNDSGPHVIEVKTDKEEGYALSKRVQALAREAGAQMFESL